MRLNPAHAIFAERFGAFFLAQSLYRSLDGTGVESFPNRKISRLIWAQPGGIR